MQSLWLALLLLPALASAARVQATLDRDSAQLGDTVTLNLRVSDTNGGAVAPPDLDPLNRDFDILGSSQNSSLSVVNGSATSTVTFGVALRPKHVGTLQIPALSVAGSQTAPLQLQVTPPDPATAVATHQDVFMEAQVEPAHGYVGQQFSYVLRLYYAQNITDGSLQVPQVSGIEASQEGDDLHYDTERGGRQYRVLERRYALVPQRAGQFEIPAVGFQGQAVDPNDPNSFFGVGRTVSASTPALSVSVQPAPASWGKRAWLPARQLSLTLDGWPAAGASLRVGQPLNLSMQIEATGLAGDALPALSLPPLDGATVYPDKPVSGTRRTGQWLVGRRQQNFALVPERAGTLTVPATSVSWWNVQTDRMEVAQIPARSLTVLPAVGAAAQPGTPASAATAVAGSSTAPAAARHAMPWRWLALGSAALWLLSVLAWLLWRRRRRPAAAVTQPDAAPTSARQCQLAFLAAARGTDSAAQLRGLLAWARAERPAIRHAGELAAALGDERQRAAIARLQQRQYAGAPVAADGAGLAEAFRGGFVWRVTESGNDPGGDLPPLYPFKLQ